MASQSVTQTLLGRRQEAWVEVHGGGDEVGRKRCLESVNTAAHRAGTIGAAPHPSHDPGGHFTDVLDHPETVGRQSGSQREGAARRVGTARHSTTRGGSRMAEEK